jgi:hypothetical protein
MGRSPEGLDADTDSDPDFVTTKSRWAKADENRGKRGTSTASKVFARDVLDYLIVHKDKLDPRYPDLRGALVGLAQLLADDPEQVRRLEELMASLAEKKTTDGAGPPVRGDGEPAPQP